MTDEPVSGAARPSHEAFWPTDLFTQGIGWVIVARFRSSGARVQAGIFLIDVFCLGAKWAVYEDCDGVDYGQRIRDHYCSRFPMSATQPELARTLVEQAVQYASSLGFAPHPDYKKAARAFGGIRPQALSQPFIFGHQGKPLYRRGPRETEAQAGRIVWQLQQRCGAGNFDFDVMLGTTEQINKFFGS
jgi:hypothetical protein